MVSNQTRCCHPLTDIEVVHDRTLLVDDPLVVRCAICQERLERGTQKVIDFLLYQTKRLASLFPKT